MTTNDMDAEGSLLDQTYFALDAEGFATFKDLVDRPPQITDGLSRTLRSKAPWAEKDPALGNAAGHDGERSFL